MQTSRSPRASISLVGLILSVVVLATSGCASSKPQGAPWLGERWQQINQGLRDGTPLSDRGQEVSRSLDSRFGGPPR